MKTTCLLLIFLLLSLGSACQQPDSASLNTQTRAITVASTQPIENALPLVSPWTSTQLLSEAIYRGLVDETADGELLPFLAEQVPTFANGAAKIITNSDGEQQIQATFTLKSTVKWSDGEPITSADALFTYALHRDNEFAYHPVAESISSIEAIDERTFQITYKPGFRSEKYNIPFNGILYPEHQLAGQTITEIVAGAYAVKPVATGPYRITSWQYSTAEGTPRTGGEIVAAEEIAPARQQIILEPNPHFAGTKPKTERIIVRTIPAEQIPLALLSGTVDLVIENERRQAFRDSAVEYSGNLRWERLDFNLRDGVMAEDAVRKAAIHAIDRTVLVKIAGLSTDAIQHSWLNQAHPGYQPVLAELQQDQSHAHSLLRSAGFQFDHAGRASRNGQTLTVRLVTTTHNPTRLALAEAIAADLEEVGFKVNVAPVSSSILFGAPGVLVDQNFDVALFSWQGEPHPDLYNLWHSDSLPASQISGNNFSGWTNTENDRLVEELDATLSTRERNQLLAEQQVLFAIDLPVLPLFEYESFLVKTPSLQAVELSKYNVPVTWNIGISP